MANVSSEASEVKEEEEFCEYCKNKGIEVEAQALYRGIITIYISFMNRYTGMCKLHKSFERIKWF